MYNSCVTVTDYKEIMKEEFEFLITSLEQLDDYQMFYNEYGICQVLAVVDNPFVQFSSGYEYEVIESDKGRQGEVHLLMIGDKINIA